MNAIVLIQHVVIISSLCFQKPMKIGIKQIKKIMKNGKGIIAPGSGIHLVLSEFTVYPDLHITLLGSHSVPD